MVETCMKTGEIQILKRGHSFTSPNLLHQRKMVERQNCLSQLWPCIGLERELLSRLVEAREIRLPCAPSRGLRPNTIHCSSSLAREANTKIRPERVLSRGRTMIHGESQEKGLMVASDTRRTRIWAAKLES